MVADHQKSGSESKRGVPKRPFGELYVLHFQTDDFFRTKSCGKQEYSYWASKAKKDGYVQIAAILEHKNINFLGRIAIKKGCAF